MDPLEIADLFATAAFTIIGLYLAHSYRRHITLRVAERRLTAYAALWNKMGIATPVRMAAWNVPQPLTAKESRSSSGPSMPGITKTVTGCWWGTAPGPFTCS